MDDAVASYLAVFTKRANEAGLDMRPPGKTGRRCETSCRAPTLA